MANSSFCKVRQYIISVSAFYGLSYLVDVRISCLVFIIWSFKCYGGPFFEESQINTSLSDGIRRLEFLLRGDIIYLFT
jgi:hypothetical protein